MKSTQAFQYVPELSGMHQSIPTCCLAKVSRQEWSSWFCLVQQATTAVTSLMLMCWEVGWEWARLRGVALEVRNLTWSLTIAIFYLVHLLAYAASLACDSDLHGRTLLRAERIAVGHLSGPQMREEERKRT